MIFRQITPRPPLDSFIDSIVYYSGLKPDFEMIRRFPDTSIIIVIDLKNTSKAVYDNISLVPQFNLKKGWIAGIQKEFITYDPGQNSSMIVIQFKPGGALPFLQIPNEIFFNKIIELEDIWGYEFIKLRERLLNSLSPDNCFNILEEFLINKTKDKLVINPYVSYFIESIQKSPHIVTLSRIIEKIGFSQKHFISIFKKYVGTTPKHYSRIIKFQETLVKLEDNKNINWTQLALQTGYYDQAHFINEFKQFSGIQPTLYKTEKGEYFNYLPIK